MIRSLFVGSLGLLLGGKGDGDGVGDGFGCGAFCAKTLALISERKRNAGAKIFLFIKNSFEPFARLNANTINQSGVYFLCVCLWRILHLLGVELRQF